jgi:(p)ppGpp synthase/HD superfamily hydrolase
MSKQLHYLNDIDTERAYRVIGRHKPDINAHKLWNLAMTSINSEQDKLTLSSTLEFAQNIKYEHIGLSSEIYFMHPLRTASYSILCDEFENVDFGIVALLHNILELSTINPNELNLNFNENITNQIISLTVNRSLQWDPIYKKKYYKKINSQPKSCRVVKIFDKLDNLFVLGLNDNALERQRYLEEIKTFILPMVHKDLPSILSYFKKLIEDTEKKGYYTEIKH